jgi:hypothetical protein
VSGPRDTDEKESISRIVDQAPPLSADAVALLRAAGLPTDRARGEKAA